MPLLVVESSLSTLFVRFLSQKPPSDTYVHAKLHLFPPTSVGEGPTLRQTCERCLACCQGTGDSVDVAAPHSWIKKAMGWSGNFGRFAGFFNPTLPYVKLVISWFYLAGCLCVTIFTLPAYHFGKASFKIRCHLSWQLMPYASADMHHGPDFVRSASATNYWQLGAPQVHAGSRPGWLYSSKSKFRQK